MLNIRYMRAFTFRLSIIEVFFFCRTSSYVGVTAKNDRHGDDAGLSRIIYVDLFELDCLYPVQEYCIVTLGFF